MILLCLLAFAVIIMPFFFMKIKKNKSDMYGNSGWRTLKLKKIRNKKLYKKRINEETPICR